MSESTGPKTFQRTYRVEHAGARSGTPQQLGGLKTKLAAEAKGEGLTLGDVSVVSTTRKSGHHSDVTLRANVDPKPPKE